MENFKKAEAFQCLYEHWKRIEEKMNCLEGVVRKPYYNNFHREKRYCLKWNTDAEFFLDFYPEEILREENDEIYEFVKRWPVSDLFTMFTMNPTVDNCRVLLEELETEIK